MNIRIAPTLPKSSGIFNKQHRPNMMNTLKPCALLLLCVVSTAASAHAVLSEPVAKAGAYYKAVVRIGHGCEGTGTQAVRVRIPDGFQGAKPQPKPGWKLSVRKQVLDKPYTSHGKTVTEDVVEITWTAATPSDILPDAQFDEFAVQGKLPDQAGPLWFKILQTCEKGSNDWSQIPASGTSTKGLKTPAALLDVQADTEHHHH